MEEKPQAPARNRPDGRILFVDVMKSLAIFFVLSYHATNYSFDFLREWDNHTVYLRYFYQTLLSCCVPLFFFVNGYLLLNRDLDLKKHIRKILRLILLTGAWAVLDTFFLLLIRGGFSSLREFLRGEEWREGWINHLWFIKALIVVYLPFPLIKAAYDKRRDAFYFFTAVAAILTIGNKFINLSASVAARLLLSKNTFYSRNWFDGLNLFQGTYGYSFVYFCVGGMAEGIRSRLGRLGKTWVCLGILLLSMTSLCAVGVTLSRIKNELWDPVWGGYDTVFTFLNVICIYALSAKYEGRGDVLRRAFSVVSANTLGIYFCHGLYNYLLLRHLERVGWAGGVPGNLLITALLLLTSLATALLLRRIPVLKRLVT